MLVEEIPGSAAVTIDGQPRFDLLRNSQNVALIGDPRNDENLVVSQLHLAFLKFHNAVLTDVKAAIGATHTLEEVFEETQRIVRWHYQWLVLHEFLRPRSAPPRPRHRHQRPEVLRLAQRPVHPGGVLGRGLSVRPPQVRPSYRANFGTSATTPRAAVHRAHLRPCGSDAS